MSTRHPHGDGTGTWTSLELGVAWAGDRFGSYQLCRKSVQPHFCWPRKKVSIGATS